MLNILRKRAQSTLIQAVVLIIAVVFVFWGVGTNLGNKRNTLATVNGAEIALQDFQRNYDNAVDNMRAQFGGSIPPGFLEGLGLNRQVLNQMINSEILRQAGARMGITVSKLATQDEIKNMDAFKTAGRFDLELYRSVLSRNRMTPTTFEAGLQRDLLTRKVSEAVNGFAVVTDSHVKAVFDYRNEEVKLAYAAVKSSDLEDMVEVVDEELAAWYGEHEQQYLGEPKIRLRYLFFAYDEGLDDIEVSEEAIRANYEQNRDTYFTPEQRRARHILIKVPGDAGTEVRAEKKKKAEEILALVRQGGDFEALAREYSEGPSRLNGGDLGFFSKGAMVEAFDQAVFQLGVGEISGVVETVFGYHIIKVEEIKAPSTRTLDEVRDEIVSELKKKEVSGVTFKKATRAYEDIIRSGSLEKYSRTEGADVRRTDYFTRAEPPGPPVSDPVILQKAFSLNKGELSSLVETSKGYAILFVDDVQEPAVPELDEVRDRVVADYRKARSRDLARAKAGAILEEAVAAQELARAVPDGVELKETGFIPRSKAAGTVDPPAALVTGAFSLSLKKPFPEEPVVQGDTFYVFQLLARKVGSETLDDATRGQLRDQLLAAVQAELMNRWLEWLRGDAEIWVNEQILQ